MKWFHLFFITIGLSLLGLKNLQAQRIFSEGFIMYHVYEADSSEPCGTYKQTVKSGNIHKEINLNSGVHQITIHQLNSGNYYSLYKNQAQYLALMLSKNEYDSLMIHEGIPEYIVGEQKKKLLDKPCTGIESRLNNKIISKGFYTTSLVLQHDYFNPLFPKLPGIVLEYTAFWGEKKGLRFVATEISESVVDQRIFNVPANYDIIHMNDLGR